MISMVNDMDYKGKIKNIMRDTQGNMNILLELNAPLADVLRYESMEMLSVSIKKYKEKRSLDANAYFHVLVGKLADKLKISKVRCKNLMIGRYGQIDYIDGQPITIKTQIPVNDMLEQENLHCLPCGGKTEKNGLHTYFYRVYRGSHTYNTEEMSVLIDGTVQEAKEQGIETATPDELEKIKNLWKGSKHD